jgi:hypothetical protein
MRHVSFKKVRRRAFEEEQEKHKDQRKGRVGDSGRTNGQWFRLLGAAALGMIDDENGTRAIGNRIEEIGAREKIVE